VESGRKAANFLVDRFKNVKDDVNIAVLEGTVDSSSAIDRKAGFEEIIKRHHNFKIIKSRSGNFNKAEGRETMNTIFKEVRAENEKIDALYCQNEDMALGAIDVIEAAGLKPGSDIVIVSNGGLKSTFQAMIEGKINADVDNPPQYGPVLIRTIIDYFDNKTIDKWIKFDNKLYTQDDASKELLTRKY
ncbi:MAG TPA: substrate-binding domain-containing protein, partial [Clostridia bacterium]